MRKGCENQGSGCVIRLFDNSGDLENVGQGRVRRASMLDLIGEALRIWGLSGG